MQFEGGATVSFSMVAFTKKICARKVHIFGTMVSIVAKYYILVYMYMVKDYLKRVQSILCGYLTHLKYKLKKEHLICLYKNTP